jgi:hypothetical protein
MTSLDDDRILEDHSLCCDVVVSDGVRHMCDIHADHLGTHVCLCGKFWLNYKMAPEE